MLDRLYTLDEFADMDGDYELDRGHLIPMTKPQPRHALICAELTFFLKLHCRQTRQGKVLCNDPGFLLQRSPDTVRGPDVAVMRSERKLSFDKWPEGAPELAVEIVSPSNSPGELHTKIGQYLEAGALLVWVVYPLKRTVVVYDSEGGVQILGEDSDLTGEPVLPGFRCAIRDLFESTSAEEEAAAPAEGLPLS